MTLLQSMFRKPKQQEPIIFKGRKTMPSIRCTDPGFVYVNSCNTDLAKTFERARVKLGIQA